MSAKYQVKATPMFAFFIRYKMVDNPNILPNQLISI